MAHNPFVQRLMIRDTDYFYGRKREVQSAYNYLFRSPQPQPCVFIGDGKIGKSSLLNYLSDPAVRQAEGIYSDRHIFVRFDFQANARIDRSGFWRLVLRRIARQIDDPDLSQEVGEVIELLDSEEALIETKELVEAFEDEGFKLYLLLDEFECIEENPNLLDLTFLNQLRSLATHHDLVYLVASEKDVYELIPEKLGSPFPNIFAQIPLGLLTEEETRELIGQSKQPVAPSLVDQEPFIVRVAGRHPYLTQIICYHLFDLKAEKGTLGGEDYETAKNRSYSEAEPYFRGDLWKSFSEREKLLLTSIAWNQTIDYTTYRAEVGRMQTNGYIRQHRGDWTLFCELFRRFVREHTEGPVNGPIPSPPRRHAPKLEYDDFELLIGDHRAETGYPIRVIRAPGAGESDDTSPIDLGSLHTSLADILARNTNRKSLKDFGQQLLKMVMFGKVQHRFYMACGGIAQRGRGLRIRLRISPPELASLPWEFMYQHEENRWLATSRSITLSRYIDAPQPEQEMAVPEVQLPLNVLCILSDPPQLANHGLPQLDLATEYRSMKEELQELIDRGLVTLEPLRDPTQHAIYEKLHRGKKEYHIVHISGHGYFFDEEGGDPLEGPIPLEPERGYLFLQRHDGDPHPVHEEDLADLLRGTGVRLVVLNACQTATSSPSQRLVGLATAIARTGPPAVVAMQYRLPDRAGQYFAREFYACLADGMPVDVCVTRGRFAIFTEFGREERDWATPVLFMRSADGMIFDVKGQ
jgi:hypothetical protein